MRKKGYPPECFNTHKELLTRLNSRVSDLDGPEPEGTNCSTRHKVSSGLTKGIFHTRRNKGHIYGSKNGLRVATQVCDVRRSSGPTPETKRKASARFQPAFRMAWVTFPEYIAIPLRMRHYSRPWSRTQLLLPNLFALNRVSVRGQPDRIKLPVRLGACL